MKYGVTLQGIFDPAEFAELARWIEELGFDNLWITDSSLHAGDCFVYMSIALQSTSRLTVGAAVTNPVTRHPAIVANVFRTLGQLAPGRVICGIGVGDRPLLMLDLPVAKLTTLEASVDVLRRLWRGETVDGAVGRWRLKGAHLRTPVDELPVYVSASGPRTLEATGAWADGAIVLAGLFPEALDFALAQLRAGRERSTRPDFETVCFLYGSIDPDPEAALQKSRSIAAWFPKTAPDYARLAGMSDELIEAVCNAYTGVEFQEAAKAAALIPDDLVRKLSFGGTPEQARAKLDWLREQAVDAVSIFPIGGDRRETIERFAEIALSGVGVARDA
jgi:5,10-methylenetetrahydromethanopterin reductase